jgi:predicted nucleotidyltransferase
VLSDLIGKVWDVRKACALLASSNQRALEMLFSELVLIDRFGFGGKLQEVVRGCLSLSRLALHFVNDAEMHYSRFIAPMTLLDCKKYVFLMRSVLSIRAIEVTRALPPISYSDLVSVCGEGFLPSSVG